MKYKFYYCNDIWSRNFFQQEGVFFSLKFCEYFSNYFENIFYKKTGLKPSSKVTIAGYKQPNNSPFYQSDSVSKLNLVLWIMPEYNDNISFCWKSKTGKIIKPTDESFDEADLECWIEGLKPTEYWKEVATEKKDHPFKIGKIPYQLKVFGFGTDTILRIFAKNNSELDLMIEKVGEIIANYNDESEKLNRVNGVVHNFKYEKENDLLIFSIDTGSAGIEITKKVLKSLGKFESIDRVEVDI